MARTIGVKYKNMIKKIVEREKAKGYPQNNANSIREVVNRELPQQAWDTWESAHSEIERLVCDLALAH